MKINKKAIYLLIFSSVLSLNLSSCKDTNVSQKETILSETTSFEGNHSVIVEETTKMITSNGKSSYQIIIPDDYSKTLFQAASEMRLLVNLSSNVTLNIVSESDYQNGPFISLGNTIMQKENVKDDLTLLGANGYKIKTLNDNVYIVSNKDFGVLNGVYGFLEHTIDFDTYAADELYYKKGDIPLMNFDIVDVPDIQYRVGDVTTKIDGDSTYRMRLKYNSNDDVFAYVKGTLYHNSLYYFPESQYSDEYYKDWYSSDKGTTDYLQLCYTSHGNQEKQNEMLEIAAALIVDTLKNFTADNVTFMQSDVNTWCDCQYCSAEKAKYGTDSAVVIKFLNKLSDKVKEKLVLENMSDRNFNICFFAYQKTENAPVKDNGDGTYSPIDESVRLKDNICVYYAPIYARYNSSFEEGENKPYAETLKKWNAISKKTFVWFYQTNFSHYLYPYNSLPTMQERYQYIAKQGAEFIFDQNQWDQSTKTAFHRLKAWMGAKLSWDVNANYEELLDEYFTHYFYEASEPMREMFDQITYHMEYLARESDMSGDIYYKINQHKYFSKPMLDNWLNLIDKAYSNISKYQNDDPVLYEKLHSRIAIEAMSIRYMIIDLYAGRFSPEKLKTMQNQFMQDCFKYGIDMVAELDEISIIFQQWGIL